MRSAARSMPWAFLNSDTIQSTIALSKLSPPRWLSPFVAFTSKTPSPSSRIETSNVPPPRSKTRIVWAAPGRCPDEPLAVLGARDDGRRPAAALRVRDDGRLAAFEHCHAAVGGTEINTDSLCHLWV